MTEINAMLPADGYLVADGGFAAHWGGLLFDTKQAGRSFVPDRGFASIGYGLPGAMGVAMAAPGKTVFSLTGDGGFNMMLGELETARRLGLDIHGHCRQQRRVRLCEGASASGLRPRHLPRLRSGGDQLCRRGARCLVATAFVSKSRTQLAGALERAVALKGPTVVDVVVTRDPAKMLPGVDNRAAKINKGDRVA